VFSQHEFLKLMVTSSTKVPFELLVLYKAGGVALRQSIERPSYTLLFKSRKLHYRTTGRTHLIYQRDQSQCQSSIVTLFYTRVPLRSPDHIDLLTHHLSLRQLAMVL
jgi:hypothetical protein